MDNNFHVEDFPKFPTKIDDERLRRRLGTEFKREKAESCTAVQIGRSVQIDRSNHSIQTDRPIRFARPIWAPDLICTARIFPYK